MAAIIVILVVIGLVLVLASVFPGTLDREGARMDLVYSVALIAVISSTIVFTFRQRWSKTLKHATIWGLLLATLVLLYSYRRDFEHAAMRIAGELIPGMAVERAPGEVFVRVSEGGHYRVRAEVNGNTTTFLVDTGASVVVLTYGDAQRVGLDLGALSFTQPVNTANGVTFVAPSRFDEIGVGPVRLLDVAGAVARSGDLDESLLGMSFLGRLRAVEFDRDGLVLRQ